MKKLMVSFFMALSLNASAWHVKLDKAISLVDSCYEQTGVPLCTDEIGKELATTNIDARGEFVYFLKDRLNKNETKEVIANLYSELQKLVPMYEKLDSCNEWSCRDIKIFLGDVSTRYVKVTEVNKDLYVKLYKTQAVQSGRYALLMTLTEKANAITSEDDATAMVAFAEFAKEYSRSIGDEYYLYQAGVAIIKNLTAKVLYAKPGHEGIYKISFTDPEFSKLVRVDTLAIMESNDRDALVVNFINSQSRATKVAFKQAGVLGNIFFSNEDVYHNDENVNSASPYFKFTLDQATGAVKGYLSTARYGKVEFTGSLVKSDKAVYSLNTAKGLTLEKIAGSYQVNVGDYAMNLKLDKRADDRTLYQAALVNPNAIISFNKVKYDENRGILTLVDSRNEKKLTLAVNKDSEGKITLNGVMVNSPIGTIFDVTSK